MGEEGKSPMPGSSPKAFPLRGRWREAPKEEKTESF